MQPAVIIRLLTTIALGVMIMSCATTGPRPELVTTADHRLFDACMDGDLEMVKQLVSDAPALLHSRRTFKQPHKPSATDRFSPLHLAVLYGHFEIVVFLIASGADVNLDDGEGWTALHVACMTRLHDDPRIVRLLLAYGASANATWQQAAVPNRPWLWQPIHVAARSGNLAAVEALIDVGASPRALDGEGKNALNHAQEHSHSAIVVLLKEMSVRPSRKVKAIPWDSDAVPPGASTLDADN